MRFLEKIGHCLFLYSIKKRLLELQKLENKYQNTDSAKFIYMPLHKAYKRILEQIKELNSQYMTFNTLIKYVQHKMTTIEGHAKDGIR